MKSNKQIIWEQKQAEVEKITDGLGKKVDSGIKETVAVFMVYDFAVSGSCEGHIKGKCSYPWIDIEAPEPEGWQKNKEKEQEWKIENLRQQKRILSLMEEFYQKRQSPFDARLNFYHIGAFGAFRVLSLGADVMELLTPEERQQKFELYRKEMRDFTKFLKDKYFNK